MTTQSSSAHFVADTAEGPYEFSPEQCDSEGICVPAVIPWSHNTVALNNLSEAGQNDEWQIYHIGDGVVNKSIWSPCYNKSDVGQNSRDALNMLKTRGGNYKDGFDTDADSDAEIDSRVAEWERIWGSTSSLPAHVAKRSFESKTSEMIQIAKDFDCKPFNCSCQGFMDYYGANPGRPNFGYGCSPPVDGPAWFHSNHCRSVCVGCFDIRQKIFGKNNNPYPTD